MTAELELSAYLQPVAFRTQFQDGSGEVYLEGRPFVVQFSPKDATTNQVLHVYYGRGEDAFYFVHDAVFGTSDPAHLNLTRLTPGATRVLQTRGASVFEIYSMNPQPRRM